MSGETTPRILHAPFGGWAIPLDEVDDPVFAGRLMGDGVAIEPLDGRLVAPCDGVVVAIHDARHAVTLRTDDGAEILIHVGLDTVALAGDGFEALTAAGARVRTGDPLIQVDLTRVGSRAPSLATPIILATGDSHAVVGRMPPGPIAAGAPLMTIAAIVPAAPPTADAGPVVRRDVVVTMAHGLHARPAARLATLAREFQAELRLEKGERSARVRSSTAVLAMAVRHGDRITVIGEGQNAEPAVTAIADLIVSGMGEAAAEPARATAPPPPSAAPATSTNLGQLAGVCAAPGLAVGPSFRLRTSEVTIPPGSGDPTIERAVLARARNAAATSLCAQAAEEGTQSAIAAAHLAFLDDPDLTGQADARIGEGMSAGGAWASVLDETAALLRRSGDARTAERADDVADVRRQVLLAIAGADAAAAAPAFPRGSILIANDLLPSQMTALADAGVAGIATARGGPTSHVAIIAAGMGLPALVAIGLGLDGIDDGTMLILDADAARIEVAPTAERLAAVERRVAEARARLKRFRATAGQDARTADGQPIAVMANLGQLADAAPAMAGGAEGCGLLRTELLFLDRPTAPDEEEQRATYHAIAAELDGRPLIVRLLDIGGDKPAPYLPIGPEENPALGLRGIRVGLAHPDVLRPQVRAILRAGAAGQCRIMIPMVAHLAELRAVRAIVEEEASTLGLHGRPKLGIMVETPAAAVMADRLAAECDFLSIGTNDLTQYTLARDRGNPAVAAGIDGLDPAILRLIGQVCAGSARHGRWTGVCGGLASDPLAVPILVGLGVTELSATPAQIARVKALIGAITMAETHALAAAALDCDGAAEVRALARAFVEDKGL